MVLRGQRIHYISGKPLDRTIPTMLMIHGAAQSNWTWEYQFKFFKRNKNFNPIVLDLPGHGKSTGEGCRSVEEYTEFTKDFVDTLDLKNLILIGHSMGGCIAQLFVLRYPELVKSPILVGTGVKLPVAKETLMDARDDYETFCAVAPQRSFSENSKSELKNKYRDGLFKTSQQVCYQDLVACNEFDIRDKVKNINLPTLIISGEEDILTPVKYGQFLKDNIKGSVFHVIKNSGHFMMQENYDEFNRVLLEFLKSVC